MKTALARRPAKPRPTIACFIEAEFPGVMEVDEAAGELLGLPVEVLADGVTIDRVPTLPALMAPLQVGTIVVGLGVFSGEGVNVTRETTDKELIVPDGPTLRVPLKAGMIVGVPAGVDS